MTKKKRNVSLNLENNSNKQIRNKNKKISNIQKNKRIDLSDKENSIRKLNNYENKNNSKDKNCVSYIQSKTQRAREYSMIVKKNNMVNNINHNLTLIMLNPYGWKRGAWPAGPCSRLSRFFYASVRDDQKAMSSRLGACSIRALQVSLFA